MADTDGKKISVLIWAKDTAEPFFKETVESVAAQTYRNFELVVLDENEREDCRKICEALFPHDGRLAYHRMKKRIGLSYALNAGMHRMTGDYAFFLGQHDKLAEEALKIFCTAIEENGTPDILYSDNDELVGIHRRHPHFKPDLNIELLRHKNYIGDTVLISRQCLAQTGLLNEKLMAAAIYDFLLRAVEKKRSFVHVPRLLYHTRVFADDIGMTKEIRGMIESVYHEHMVVAQAHLKRMGVDAKVEKERSLGFWRLDYNGRDYAAHRGEYFLVREDNVRIRRQKVMERMYGILRQPDVAMVGVRFDRFNFTIDNCGYIFDTDGIAYPACHNQSAFQGSYDERAIVPCDVSMVDPCFFMIDRKVFNKVGGFNSRLKGRAQMLDLCLKIRRAKRRIVVDAQTTATKKARENISSQDSNALLLDLWKDELAAGDPYYNKNLPIGLDNYRLY